MKAEENEKIFDYLGIKKEDCIGFNQRISDLQKGMTFYITPRFLFPLSKDEFTFEEAIKVSRIQCGSNSSDFEINSALGCYNQLHKIVKVQKRRKKGEHFAYLRVLNTKTLVEYCIIKDDDEIDEFDAFYLLFVEY